MKLSFNKRLEQICSKKSNLLCIGLDPDPEKMPHRQDKSILGIECFIKDVIAATIDFCPVYKPNFAFYERFGSKGYIMLEKIVDIFFTIIFRIFYEFFDSRRVFPGNIEPGEGVGLVRSF